MIGHRQARELLARRAELPPEDERRLQDHLQVCQQCRRVAAAFAHQAGLLRSLPMAAPPAALRDNVLRNIRQPSARRAAGIRLPAWFLMPAAAVAVAVVAAIILMHQPRGAGERVGLAHARPAATRAAHHPSSAPAPQTRRRQVVAGKQDARRSGGRRRSPPHRYVAAVPATPFLAVPQVTPYVAQQPGVPAAPGGALPVSGPPGDFASDVPPTAGAPTGRVAPMTQRQAVQPPPAAPAPPPGKAAVPRAPATDGRARIARPAAPSPAPRSPVQTAPRPQPQPQPTPPLVAVGGPPAAQVGAAPPAAPVAVPTNVPPTPTPLPLRLPAYIPAPPQDTPTPITAATPIP